MYNRSVDTIRKELLELSSRLTTMEQIMDVFYNILLPDYP